MNRSPEIFFFSSKAGNTRRLVSKLPFTSMDVRDSIEELNAPFILVVPTYVTPTGTVPPQVKKFLSDSRNRKYLVGVIGTGNKNFGKEFCIAADAISKKCLVPILAKIEFSGTESEISEIISAINKQLAPQETED